MKVSHRLNSKTLLLVIHADHTKPRPLTTPPAGEDVQRGEDEEHAVPEPRGHRPAHHHSRHGHQDLSTHPRDERRSVINTLEPPKEGTSLIRPHTNTLVLPLNLSMSTHVSNYSQLGIFLPAFFRCYVCKETKSVEIDRGRIAEPSVCPNCQTLHSMALVHNRSLFTDKQMIKLQESPGTH